VETSEKAVSREKAGERGKTAGKRFFRASLFFRSFFRLSWSLEQARENVSLHLIFTCICIYPLETKRKKKFHFMNDIKSKDYSEAADTTQKYI